MVPLYIGSKRTISTYITEESSNNNSHMSVSPMETVCFYSRNCLFLPWKQNVSTEKYLETN